MSKNIALGIIGGGQLGSMLCQAAKLIDIKTLVYCDDKEAPAQNYSDNFFCGEYDDLNKLKEFASKADVITFEFENIPVTTLENLQKIKPVFPDPKINMIIQDRSKEKYFVNELGIPTTNYKNINNQEDFKNISDLIPGILKTTTLGYDGKGQIVIDHENDAKRININNNFILEKKINLKKEISVIVTRYQNGKIIIYDPIENVHKNQILETSSIPAKISQEIKSQSKEFARIIAEKLDYIGTMCVEFFIDQNDNLLVNEIAPRVHNSGHLSINAYSISQFESHVRAVCNLDIKIPKILNNAIMKNIIGDDISVYREKNYSVNEFFYDYLKKEAKPKRKMGHLTTILD